MLPSILTEFMNINLYINNFSDVATIGSIKRVNRRKGMFDKRSKKGRISHCSWAANMLLCGGL